MPLRRRAKVTTAAGWALYGWLLCLANPLVAATPPIAFMRAEVSPVDGERYVQQQILYISRLFYRIPLMAGKFTPPAAPHAVVEALGDKRRYRVSLAGQRYRVMEQRYVIFPERSGRLKISPAGFTAITSPGGRSSLHSREQAAIRMMLQSTGGKGRVFGDEEITRFALQGDVIELAVEPRPQHYRGIDWLPGQELVLHDSWEETPPLLRVGEPAERTLTLEAKGLDASQLPALQLPESAALRIYPQPAELSNRSDGDWMHGASRRKFTYVATHSGKLKLPALRIDWWDVANRKQRQALLPAREIEVVGAGSTDTGGNSHAPGLPVGAGLMVVLLALAGAGAVTVRSARKRGFPFAGSVHGEQRSRRAAARAALQAACEQNRPQEAARALLAWAAVTWPEQPPCSLEVLAVRVQQGRQAIRELEACLYGATCSAWRGEVLWAALGSGLRLSRAGRKRHQRRPGRVPPLYPDLRGR